MNRSSTKVLVFAYPDWQYTAQLSTWCLQRFPKEHIYACCDSPLIVARNLAMKASLAVKDKFTDFLFVDKDMLPDKHTDPFLDAEGDVVCARTALNNASAWAQPDAFHCGLFRFNRKTLEALTPPWFMFQYSANGCKIEKCECTFFKEKCEAAGLTVRNAGYCGHFKPITGTWHGGS